MALKKVIAICQSGGNFETGKDDSMSYIGGEAYAIDLDAQSQLSHFKEELAEMFQYNVDSLSVKYFLPGNRKTLITISRDKDLQRMVNFFEESGQVELFILSKEGTSQDVVNAPLISSSRANTEGMNISHEILNIAEADGTTDIEMDTANGLTRSLVVSGTTDDNCRNIVMQWENIITGVDQRFSDFTEFRDALHKYSIAHGFTYKFIKNESQRVAVKCKAEGCPWRIWASMVSGTQLFCIKKMNSTHTCEGAAVKAKHRVARDWVGNIIKEKLKVSPNYKTRDIVGDIKREYGIELNYSQAYRAKGRAREKLHGSYRKAYSQLPLFCEKIVETNPGSVATFTTKEDSSFQRLFVSFYASISGFRQGCRPLIFLDYTPLNSKYKGMLLSATAADGNDAFFPLAFAVVDEESDENWHWFLSHLKDVASTSQRITFVADFQKGLVEALREIFGGGAFHGYCLHHIAEKLNKDLKEPFSYEARRLMVQDLYAAARASKLDAFERCTESMKAISPEAYNWVIRSEPDHWATAFFGGARYGHISSDFGRPFYSWVSDAKELPITQMVDSLRGKLMELFYKRRIDSSQWETKLTLSMEEKLKNEISKAHSLQVTHLHDSTFEVRSESVDIVNIEHWDCSCKSWQITGLPCCHAVALIKLLDRSPYDYCFRYFTAESYRATYSESINPIPNVEGTVMSEPTETAFIVTPPPTKSPSPKVGKRRKQDGTFDIIRRTLQCSKCKGLGHNKRACSKVSEDGEESSGPSPSIDVTTEES
ncbi:uncharacterized protein LOC108205860 [Daucus carota subsp. sativus]|uniref:uncharacterized protein LOC108205860 n=1 Tax=Daucus carota subsp. sativus TaxID=79200 RepID=UPI0007EF9E3A|nr:PREDICTED: uncharacterized protein LOC108205860 [Daucus carota subsp. sativus]XP_017231452.1 PREDICTED: uncharacterized protein LOC108205860 [Daucus carota subsp. sativus]XP_017231453.1 PREDICTED: uncharacterized protein LOC108205860 [Daucus carota subsp. sativus]XP_017231454.1 PREDICTED: uncharacterized protein LOC108205860 [Daucus carota subsp. sativus]XP_017231455.1 PREDICTED: uncharacterized protein LOC108205860 [Daucus carota subsp. sativus]